MEEIDDDFGDLYADVEVQASAAINGVPDFTRLYIEPEKPENEDRNSTKNPNPYAGFNSVPKSLASSPSGEDGMAKKVLGSEGNGEKDLAVYNDSDSEDDLNIVLNDEDCKLFSGTGGASVKNGGVVGEGGCEEVEDGDENFVGVMEGTGSSKNQKQGDQLDDRLELNSNGHVSGERGNGLKGNYNSHYKHKRQKFPSKMKANVYAGMASFSSMLARGHWDDDCNQHKGSSSGQVAHIHATSSSLKAPSGYGFSLPWYRTVLDVNIDTFEEKPWRYDGVDVTDFFNFGFNEDSWKRYCNSLEQFRQQRSTQSRIPVYESSKLNQAYDAGSEHEKLVQEDTTEEITQVGFGRIVSPSSKFADRGVRQLELPRGKAIQVEGSIAERQPSMDVRRPLGRDSDVIQITVQDSSEDSYGSCKEGLGHIDGNVHEASENGDLNAEDDRDIHSPCSASGDELSVESLKGNAIRLERPSVLKRSAISELTES